MKKSLFLALFFLFVSLVQAQDRQAWQLNNVAAIQSSTHWQPVKPQGSTGMNMTIIGIVQFDGVEQYSAQLEVGVFHNGECRGAGLANVVALNRNFVFLTVYGLNGEVDTFKIYDHASGTELDMATVQTITYVDNGTLGTLPSPYAINFVPNYFEITATADPLQGGTVSGDGIYNPGNTAILTATANTGYSFTNWTKDDVQVSTSSTYSFVVSENASFVAHFSLNNYVITATANPNNGGSVTGGGNFDHGTTCTLTATANVGYSFVNWTKDGNVVSSNETYEFTVTGAGSYQANFALNSYDITASANPTEGGSANGGGTYSHGTMVNLTAVPADYYYFINWTKNGEVVSTNPNYSFAATGNGNYVANFGINSYHISVSAFPIQGGSVTGSGNYNNGSIVTLTASPNPGYDFVNWTKNGEEVSTSANYSFVVIEDASYVAHFAANIFEVTATADPADCGTVTGADIYYYGATARLRAIPNEGYSFVNWTRNGEVVATSASYNFTVTENVDLVAHFILSTYNITVAANPSIGGVVNGGGLYQHGSSVTLTAVPNTEYDFVNWTKGVAEVSTDATYVFNATGNGNYVAHFSLRTFDISAMADPSQGGTISGAGAYNKGASCTLIATANTGYSFVNWTRDDTIVSTSSTMSFQVYEDACYVAHFSLNSYVITVMVNPSVGGTVSGAGSYSHGTTATLSALPNEGYRFVNWTKDDVPVSTQINYSFIVDGPGNYTANFLPFYEITATANPEVGGTVSGAGEYYQGETVTLTATPATGYGFVNWTENNVEVSTSATYSFNASADRTLVANFDIASITFIGSETNHNWSIPSNWNTGALPTAEDGVVINGICELDESATVASLSVNDGKSIAVKDGKTLTVTGLLTTTDENQLVIEDGGQLVNEGNNVLATVRKDINGFGTSEDNWYMIASPVTDNTSVTNLTANVYNLFTFDGSEVLEWRTQHDNPAISHKTGYLYGNQENTTLEFKGTLAGTTDATVLTLTGGGEGMEFSDFNMIGNPYPCNAYITESYLRMNTLGNGFLPGTGAIKPCESVFVEAADDGQTVTFSKTPTRISFVSLTVSKNEGVADDRVIVRFDNSRNIEKFMFNEGNTKFYIPQSDKEFAVVSTAGISKQDEIAEIPVNFKASEKGTYAISFDLEDVSAEYIHLVDNMTGADIDLLAASKVSASYTFDSKPSNYASRFKLVFDMTGIEENVSAGTADFAYISNGNIVIENIEGQAVMQIVDVLGRVINTEIVSGSYNKAHNLSAGLYIISLNGKTQKIVVE